MLNYSLGTDKCTCLIQVIAITEDDNPRSESGIYRVGFKEMASFGGGIYQKLPRSSTTTFKRLLKVKFY